MGSPAGMQIGSWEERHCVLCSLTKNKDLIFSLSLLKIPHREGPDNRQDRQ